MAKLRFVKSSDSGRCLLFDGDGRDLRFLSDDSVDCIVTDHPYKLNTQLKGGNRDFADYDLFQYEEKDFAEKFRVLKPGCFLAEFIPEESAVNFEYLFRIKEMAKAAGFEYYAKVPWIKGKFVANTGRKSKNTEDVLFLTKGPARCLRPDAKKDKADPSIKHFMLPTAFNFDPPKKADRIHQAEKPAALIQSILSYTAKKDEVILDQFAGSGSLGEACLQSGFKCILIENPRTL